MCRCAFASLACVLVFTAHGWCADEEPLAMRVLFGVTDRTPQAWDGSIALDHGELIGLTGWHFLASDAIEGHSWQAATRADRIPQESVELGIRARLLRPGLIVRLRAGPATRAELTTPRGVLRCSPGRLALGARETFLDGAVVVERVPLSEQLGGPNGYDDYPQLAAFPDGGVEAAWIAFDPEARSDSIMARRLAGHASPPRAITPQPGDLFGVQLAVDRRGRAWFVWSAQVDGNWDLYARFLDGESLSEPERLTTASGPDIFHRVCRDSAGNLYVVWMGFRDGSSDVFIQRFDGKRWSGERRVSTSAANDWEPAVAADAQGRVLVVWDSYDRGNSDIFLRQIDADEWDTPDAPWRNDPVPITNSPNFEAHPAIAVDRDDRIWLAWDEAGPAWGKDSGWFVKGRGTTLYSSRGIRVACYTAGKLMQPANVYDAIPQEFQRYVELPALSVDGAGRVWMAFRHRSSRFKETGQWNWSTWELYVTCLLGDHWLPAVYVPDSNGRNDMRTGLAAAGDGTMVLAWATDQWSYDQVIAQQTRVRFARLRLGGVPAASIALEPFGPNGILEKVVGDSRWRLGGMQLWTETTLKPAISETEETEDLKRLRGYRYERGKKTYRVLRGDTHRHTDISYDGANDGSLEDCYRYAMDAGGLDFLALTDHSATGGDEMGAWWRTQKYADLFHLPGRFLPIYSYERSVGYPNGHRNVLLPRRGVRPLAIGQPEQKAKARTGSVLYEHLKREGGIDFPHTTASGMGEDWADYDPTVEPVVELYSGFWYSSEHPNAPKTRPEMNQANYRFRPGFVWNAWAKGYKLGVEASSDHISTHLSLACPLVETATRAGIFDAFRARRCYAASANILLDVRIRDDAGDHLMGEAFRARGPIELTALVHGTTMLRRIEIIKNNEFVYSQEPSQPEARLAWRDGRVEPGESYYYVRVQQRDDNVAWSSPIWVTHAGKPAGARE